MIELRKLPMREDNGFKPSELKDLAAAQAKLSKRPDQAIGCVLTYHHDTLLIAVSHSVVGIIDALNDAHPGLLPGSPGYIDRDKLWLYLSREPDIHRKDSIEAAGIKHTDWPRDKPSFDTEIYQDGKLVETKCTISGAAGLSQERINELNDLPDEVQVENADQHHLAEFRRKQDIPGGRGKFEALTLDEITAWCIHLASGSLCKKRKVGCVIVHDGEAVASGWNKPGADGSEAKDDVIHAEAVALIELDEFLGTGKAKPRGMANQFLRERLTLYCTHEPCAGCIASMKASGVRKWVVVDNFMKFDTGKLRHDLIPAIVYTALAAIFTYGAKKYSPNNWKQCKDLGQYKAAVMRHWVAYINGERLDADSGKPHLWHVLTNVAFLIWFDDQESKQNEK